MRKRNSFYNFVQGFWERQYWHSGWDDDDWHPLNSYKGKLNKSSGLLKTNFSYKLSLQKMKSSYLVSVTLQLSHQQYYQIQNKIKVKTKKEAIKASLTNIKKFEKEKLYEVWPTLFKKYAILKQNKEKQWEWFLTIFIDSPRMFLSHKSKPCGYGKFISINYDTLCFGELEIRYGGHSSGSCKVTKEMVYALKGLCSEIDDLIKILKIPERMINLTQQYSFKKRKIEEFVKTNNERRRTVYK